MTHRASALTAAGAVWKKSSYSGPEGNNCIEVAGNLSPESIFIRDSKTPQGAALAMPRAAWAAFAAAAGEGTLSA